jgi:hypothetical protein
LVIGESAPFQAEVRSPELPGPPEYVARVLAHMLLEPTSCSAPRNSSRGMPSLVYGCGNFCILTLLLLSPDPSTRCHRRRRPPTRCRYRAGWPVWKSHSGSSRAARRLLVFWGVLVENPQAIHPLSPAWPSRSDGFGRLLGSTCTWYIAISDKKLSYLVHTDPPFSNPHHVPTTSRRYLGPLSLVMCASCKP